MKLSILIPTHNYTCYRLILELQHQAERLGIDYDLNRKIYETLPSITLKDLVDFEKNNIVGKPRLRLILGNKDELNISALEKLGPVRYLTTEEIFGY